MSWNLLLYGCFTTRGRGYEFDVLAPGDMEVGRKIRSAGLAAPSWFTGRYGDRSFVGGRDLVGKHLGFEHPIARDRARNLEFILAYIGPANAVLPAWHDMNALHHQFANDLRSAAELAMATSKPTLRQVAARPPRFDGARSDAGVGGWDALITQLAPRLHGIVVAGNDGTARLVRWDHLSDIDKKADRRNGAEPGGSQTTTQHREGCGMRFAGLGALAVVLGAAAAFGISAAHGVQEDVPTSEGGVR